MWTNVIMYEQMQTDFMRSMSTLRGFRDYVDTCGFSIANVYHEKFFGEPRYKNLAEYTAALKKHRLLPAVSPQVQKCRDIAKAAALLEQCCNRGLVTEQLFVSAMAKVHRHYRGAADNQRDLRNYYDLFWVAGHINDEVQQMLNAPAL